MDQNINKNILIGIYSHPEIFPPTLNAVMELSKFYNSISLVYRNNLKGNWTYRNNVKLVSSGNYISVTDQMSSSTLKKLYFFVCYLIAFMRQAIVNRPAIILVYDPVSLFAYSILKQIFWFKHIIWYHNHDVFIDEEKSKFSLMKYSIKAEKKAFEYLNIFSLPSLDRRKYFPLNFFKGKFFFIPNYPSLEFYNKFFENKTLNSEIRIIFQGQISDRHGLEEIIDILNETISGKTLKLILKGYCSVEYKNILLQRAAFKNVTNNIEFYGITPYNEVPIVSSQCHIGLAIFKKEDIMNSTLGTSSNKIYEYIALGLPVLLFDNEHFRFHLENKQWSFFTDTTKKSLLDNLKFIVSNYEFYSAKAREDFEENLYFEKQFGNLIEYLNA